MPMIKYVDDVTIFDIPWLQSNNVYITFTTASTTSHLQHNYNSITRWTSNNNMKLMQREEDKGVYRVFFEKSTIITASDGQ